MNKLNQRDTGAATSIVFVFMLLTNTISFWGEAVALSYFLFEQSLDALAIVIILEALIWGMVANIQARFQARYNRQEIISITSLVVGGIVFVSIFVIDPSYHIGIGIFFIAAHLLSHTYRQHALAHVGPLYAQRHRRNTLMNLVLLSRVLSGAILFVSIFLIGDGAFRVFVMIWLGLIVIKLALLFWRPLQAEGYSPLQHQAQKDDTRIVTSKFSPIQLSVLFHNGITRWLTANTLSITFLSSLVLYETAIILQDQFDGVVNYLRFFAFVGFAGIGLTLPLSLRVLGLLLRQFNAGRLVWIFPFMLNIAFVGLLLLPNLLFAALGEIVRSPLRKTLYDPIERLLYRAMPDSEEEWARRQLVGTVDPFGRLLAGGVLLAFGSVRDHTPLLIIGIGAGLFFFLSARRTGFLYGQTLAGSLQMGQYRLLRQDEGNLSISDQAHIQTMIQQLRDGIGDERDLLLIAEAVSQSEFEEAYQVLCGIWNDSPPIIQTELLPLIVNGWPHRYESPGNRDIVFEALESEHSPLRRQALLMIAAYPQLDPNYRIARFLIDPDPKVDVIAAWILMKHPLEQVRHAARAQLRWLAKDNHVSTRVTAINALVNASLNSFGELVAPLDIRPYMLDNATRVREAVLPAASIEQLIEAARDHSVDVRKIAIQQLRLRRFQGVVIQLQAAVAEHRQVDQAAHHLQIEASLDYWRLLVALRSVSWLTNPRKMIENLQEGFEQLGIIDAIIETLRHMDFAALGIIVKQLERDRLDLLEAMIDYLNMIVGKDRIGAIIWILKAGQSHERYQVAFEALVNITNPLIASKLAEALHEQRLLGDDNQSPLPEIAFRVLLSQQDEWRPMLTLYALSAIPQSQRQQWVDSNQVQKIIKNSLYSSSDVIREGARLVRRVLDNHDQYQRYDLESHFKKSEEERTLMLSTLERMLFLRNVSFFENLHLEQLRALARGCEEITALENERILRQGEVGDSLFIIVEGRIRIQLSQEGQRPTVIGTLGSSEVFGEISLLDGGVRTADVVTETPVLLLSIHREALNTALEDDPNIAMIMLQAMAQRLRRTTEIIDYHLKEKAND